MQRRDVSAPPPSPGLALVVKKFSARSWETVMAAVALYVPQHWNTKPSRRYHFP